MKFSLKKKMIVLIVTTLFLACGAAVMMSARMINDLVKEQYYNRSVNVCKTMAFSIDAEKAARLRDAVMEIYETIDPQDRVNSEEWGTPEFDAYLAKFASIQEMEEFQEIKEQLRQFQETNQLTSTYVVHTIFKEEVNIYLVDASTEYECLPGTIDIFYGNDINILTDPDTGYLPNITDTEEYGWLMATGMPVYDAQGELVCYACADISMNEVMEQQRQYILRTALMLLGMTVVFGILSLFLVDHFVVKPIKLLTTTSESYYEHANESGSEPNNTVSHRFAALNIHTGDEIESLLASMKHMEEDTNAHIREVVEKTRELAHTKERADEMDRLANRDGLTKVFNKRAYEKDTERITEDIAEGMTEFSVAMVDLNGLKPLNDTYGHKKGDYAIMKLCGLISKVFEGYPVYRYGGDEFVVIIPGKYSDRMEELCKSFEEEIAEIQKDDTLEPWDKISAAIGCSAFNPETDVDFEDVFRRADEAMYRRKKQMKGLRIA